MPHEVQVDLRPGKLNTSLHPASVPPGYAQANLNCNTDRGAWEVDKRYRQPQPAPAATPGVFVIGAAKDGKEILAVHNGSARKVALTAVDAVDGTASQWTSVLTNGSGLGTDAWQGWQYQKWAFITNPDVGVRYYEIGTMLLEKLYINYDLNSSANLTLERPPYPKYEFGGGDTITSGANHSGGDFQLTGGGIQMYDGWDPTGYQQTRHEFIVDFNTDLDLSKVDYLHFTGTTLQGNMFDASIPLQFRIFNSTHTTQATSLAAVVKRAFSNDYRTIDIWIDLTGIPRAQRTAVTKILMQLHLWRDGPDGFHLKPMDKGGIYLQSYLGSKIDPVRPTSATDIEYAYSFWEPGGPSETGATIVTLPGVNSLGERFSADLPYMGVKATVSVTAFTDPPYNAGGSKVRIYRKVGPSWYRIDDNSLSNTGTVTWTDDRTADEVKALGSPVTLTIGGIDPAASGEVKGIDCGCQWKGANVYFGGGKAFFSRVNNFKDVLWDQILTDNSPDEDIARPRTMLADPMFGQVVIAVVPQDALYMFSRLASSYINGDVPSQASFPGILPIRGVVGPRAACAWRGGALVCSDDGLWFVRVPSGQSSAPPTLDEVTKDVRPTYAAVIGGLSARAATCIGVIDDEIWVVCENRYLHFTREGSPIYGEFTAGKSVVGIQTHPEYGMVFLVSDGSLGKVGAWTSDGGTNAAGSNGSAVSWTWRSRRFTEPWNWLGFRALYQGDRGGSSDVRGKVFSERNAAGDYVQFTNALRTVGYDVYPRDMRHAVNGGRWSEIEISGKATDVVFGATAFVSGSEERWVQVDSGGESATVQQGETLSSTGTVV